MKTCVDCRADKDASCFGKNRRSKDGLAYCCRPCAALRAKAWRIANPDRQKEHAAASYAKWRNEHPGQQQPWTKAASSRYRQRHPEAGAASNKRFREKHPGAGRAYAQSLPRAKVNAQAKAWRDANPGKAAVYAKAYADRNPELQRERRRKWAQANPDKVARKASARRAATFRAIPAWLSSEDRAAIAAKFAEAKRISCETGVKHHVDHAVPLKGKTASGLHVPWNLQVIPARVNQRKWNKIDPDLPLAA